MTKRSKNSIQEAERLICMNIKSFIVDFCLIDKAFLIENIINSNHHILNDVIESSSEMFFKPGTLSYNYNARLSERHNAVPSICIDMRFSHKHVLFPFFLHIEDNYAGVSLTKAALQKNRAFFALSQLSDAFYDARIYNRSHHDDTLGPRSYLLN